MSSRLARPLMPVMPSPPAASAAPPARPGAPPASAHAVTMLMHRLRSCHLLDRQHALLA